MPEPHESCAICRQIADRLGRNFLEDGVEVPVELRPLRGWEGQSLSSGYKKFRVTCPECETDYLVEIDVEPFVWDFDVTRLAGRFAGYEGLY